MVRKCPFFLRVGKSGRNVASMVPREQGQFDGVPLCCRVALGNLPVVVTWPERVGLGKGRGTSAVECCQCHNALLGRWC